MGNELEEFKGYLTLMKDYLTLVLQTATLALTVTTGVAAYIVKGEGDIHYRGVLLLLPAALCLGLGLGFTRQVAPAIELRDRLVALAKVLGFGLAPHGNILVGSLRGFGALLLAMALVLVVLAVIQIVG
jgi:hypothetical protein